MYSNMCCRGKVEPLPELIPHASDAKTLIFIITYLIDVCDLNRHRHQHQRLQHLMLILDIATNVSTLFLPVPYSSYSFQPVVLIPLGSVCSNSCLCDIHKDVFCICFGIHVQYLHRHQLNQLHYHLM